MLKSSIEDSDIFWGEISPCDHLVQIYEDEAGFLDSLEKFVCDGLDRGESVILIATPQHLGGLEERLVSKGVSLHIARAQNRYVTIEAEQALSRFLVDGWPDEERFRSFVTELLLKARAEGRRVRAFGEMVALLWAQGHSGATVRLEHLWNTFCQQEAFCLFCAYPKSGFTQDAEASLREICEAHSRVMGSAAAA